MADKFNLGEAGMIFTGTDDDFQKTAGRVEKTMEEVAASMKAQAHQIDLAIAKSVTGFNRLPDDVLRALRKTSSGVRSELAEVERALKGADDETENFLKNVGKMTALNLVGNGLMHVAKGAEEVATQIRLGNAVTDEMIDKMADGIPVIGHFWAAVRAVHELIGGEKAYVELLKEQTKEQDERTQSMGRYLKAMKELNREREDLTKGLTMKPGVGFDISGIVAAGERQKEDLPGKMKARFKEQFDDIEKLRAEQDAKMKNLQNPTTFGEAMGVSTNPARLADIANVQKRLDELTEESNKLADAKKNLEDETRATINMTTTKGGIDVLLKALDAQGKAVDAYVKHLPKMSETTKQILKEQGTAWDQFEKKMKAMQADAEHGFLPANLFQQQKFGAQIDAMGSIIEGYIAKVKPAIETNLRFFDSFMGAPIERGMASVKKMVDQFIAPFEGKSLSIKVPELKANFVGLADLHNKIQAAHSTATDEGKVARDQLEELRQLGRSGRESAETLKKINDGLGRAGRAIPS